MMPFVICTFTSVIYFYLCLYDMCEGVCQGGEKALDPLQLAIRWLLAAYGLLETKPYTAKEQQLSYLCSHLFPIPGLCCICG